MSGTRFTILVIGGYGVFGSSICRLLARDSAVRVIVAGRSQAKADAVVRDIRAQTPVADIEALAFDKTVGVGAALARTDTRLVIDAAGPFQGQGYAVARDCIAQGVHYVDLADAREFVVEFHRLDQEARAAGVLAVSGASSVPGLSSAVVDHLTRDMKTVDDIAMAIAPGNRSPRGFAVVAAILGTVGQVVPRWRHGAWGQGHGWQGLRRLRLRLPGGAELGHRWVVSCDVPDIVLFPARYPGVQAVTFQAGLELGLMHFGLWALSWPVRWGWLRSLEPWTPLIFRIAVAMQDWGSDRGGMVIDVSGAAGDGARRRRRWTLIAGGGHGPQVPAVPAVILAGKLARGWALTGAMPCLGLFEPAEFERAVSELDIACATEELHG